jgi:GH24 family phage-related lysozyme (muramidase)
MIDHDRARALIEPFEGNVPHMYLDTHGYVTVGVGNLLATPQTAIPLVWLWRDPKRRQHEEPGEFDISDEWMRVHGCTPGLTASSYRPVTSMELHPAEIRRLFSRRVDEFETSLQHHFPEFAAWPEAAQLATLDMAFNLGAGALPRKWPNLSAALHAQNWREAAHQSHRPESRPARNQAIGNLYLQAAG